MTHRHNEAVDSAPARDATSVLRKLVPYFAPHRTRLLLVGLIAVVGTLVELMAPYLLGVAVDGFIDPTKGVAYRWLQPLIGAGNERLAGLTAVMILLAVSYALNWGLNVVQFRAMVQVAQGVLLRLRAEILAKLHGLSLDFYDQHEAGDLMSRLTNDTQTINDMFGVGITRLIRMVLGMVGIIIAMVALNWRLALASYTVLPVIVVLTAFFTRKVRRAYREARKTIGQVSAELQENIAGVREVQAFAREQETIGEFRAVNAAQPRRQRRGRDVERPLHARPGCAEHYCADHRSGLWRLPAASASIRRWSPSAPSSPFPPMCRASMTPSAKWPRSLRRCSQRLPALSASLSCSIRRPPWQTDQTLSNWPMSPDR